MHNHTLMQRIGIFVPGNKDVPNGRLKAALHTLTTHAAFDAHILTSPSSCGWMPYTQGDWRRARQEARAWLQYVQTFDTLAIPAPSCVQFVRHHMNILFAGHEDILERLEQVRARTWDLGRFLHHSGYTPPPRELHHTCVLVPSCVSPHLPGIVESAHALLSALPGLEVNVLPLHRCCSWGGAFHHNMPELSQAMMETIVEAIRPHNPHFVVVLDPGCIPLLRKVNGSLPVYHLIEVLAGVAP